ncbi:MAG: nitroreductase [Candidatus Brocadiae bacterium]|nr:nitroreductase [Candidatus Brocadiia bacterium]
MLNQGPLQWMERRKSWRDYTSELIAPKKLEFLQKTFQEIKPPFGNQIGLEIVNFKGDIKPFLTYGFIKGANTFIAGKVSTSSPMNWEDYGWAMEHLILVATGLEIDTCWLGGTFRRTCFSKKLELKKDETIPAVVAIGCGKQQRSFRDQVIRTIAASHTRKLWATLFFENDFSTPLIQTTEEYSTALNMIRLAPSAANRQPWRILKQKDTFHFYLKRSAGYDQHKKADLQRVDMGIAFLHFDWALREFKTEGKWIQETPDVTKPMDMEYIASWKKNS